MFDGFEDLTGTFTTRDVVLAIGLSFVLSVALALVYRATHRGVSYSQSFAQTLVMLGMIVALVMLIVGSNLARAFTLGGALSIIRFRNAVKETRDVGFIFLVMVVGMAAGTRFYGLAIIATIAIGGAIYVMTKMDWFALDVRSQVVRVQLPIDEEPSILDDTFLRLTSRSELVSAETIASGTVAELLFSVQLKRSTTPNDLVRALLEQNAGHKVSILTGYDRSDL